jgi:hypothetical protein
VSCSGTASNIEEALAIAAEIGRFPLIIRPAFTLGGTGGGISYNLEEFKDQVKAGIDASMTDQVCFGARLCVLNNTSVCAEWGERNIGQWVWERGGGTGEASAITWRNQRPGQAGIDASMTDQVCREVWWWWGGGETGNIGHSGVLGGGGGGLGQGDRDACC